MQFPSLPSIFPLLFLYRYFLCKGPIMSSPCLSYLLEGKWPAHLSFRNPSTIILLPSIELTIMKSACSLISLFIITVQADVLFHKVDPNLLRFGNLETCGSVTLATIRSSSRIACANQCSLHLSCRAFLWIEMHRSCSQLSSPCKPTTSAIVTQMMKRQGLPSSRTLRFKESKYLLTEEIGTFSEIQKKCASYGMYIWIPNTMEEATFVEQNIMSSLSKDYRFTFSDHYKVWIGVVDVPNGNCLLSDYVTPCPIEKYNDREPSSQNEQCTHFLEKADSVWRWNDILCDRSYHGICEGAVIWFRVTKLLFQFHSKTIVQTKWFFFIYLFIPISFIYYWTLSLCHC